MALPTDTKISVTRERSSYPRILEFANETRTAGEFTDVTIVVGRTNIPANRVILSCCSEFFLKLFQTQTVKESNDHIVNITADIDPNSVKLLVDFIYTGTVTINEENAIHLLKASDYLQLEEPKQFCIEFLNVIVSHVNCIAILGTAIYYSIKPLQERIYKMVSGKLKEFAQTDDFKSFTKEDLVSCIFHLDRKLAKETTIYQAIITWTKHDEENRKMHFPDLLELINFDDLPSNFLRDVVSTENLINKNLLCVTIVMEALRKALHQPKISPAVRSESKIISVGGKESVNQIIEVFSCDDNEKSIYPDLPFDIKYGKAIKSNEFVYFLLGLKVVRANVDFEFSTFEKVPSMNIRLLFGAALFSGNIVVTGGFSAENSAECFDTEQNEWKPMKSTNVGKYFNSLVTCDEYLYDTGGFDGRKSLSCVERLRGLEEDWELVQPMQIARGNHAAVSCNGFIYVIGGSIDEKSLSSVEKYDPLLNLWVFVKEMNIARYRHAACVFQGKIYVVGGKNSYGFVKEIECYDPTTDTWNIVGDITRDLFGHSLIVL